MKRDLSILIPARNEQFLAKTVEDILLHIEGDTEVIVVLDGQWADPGVPDDPRVRVIYLAESMGQRATTNMACRLSEAKYVMKADAHCAFDQGFDVKMMKEMHDDWTMIPTMRNLHAFNWVCKNGHSRYQGPSGPCSDCGEPTTQDVVWIPKRSPQSNSFCFDSEPHFQYFNEYCKRPEGQGEIAETMSIQGSCFMMTRAKYWELNICDEAFGSWGSQGIEVAVKTWLSGGRVMVNRKTWYGHMFRTQGGDFGFPYPQSGRQVSHAKKHAKSVFFENKWPLQVRPLSWLLERFWPVKGWTDAELANVKKFDSVVAPQKPLETELPPSKEGPSRGIIFYTDNNINLKVAHAVQKQLKMISEELNIPMVSASLKPMPHFGKNVHLPLERGYLTMFKQILAALEASTADVIYFCEHDVFYHPSHFDFVPETKDDYYYNVNWWRVPLDPEKSNLPAGFAVSWEAAQVSGLSVYREFAIEHYRRVVKIVEAEGYSNRLGFEPGSRNTEESVAARGGKNAPADGIFIDGGLIKKWKSEQPNVDIKHGKNLSKNKWSLADFRDKSSAVNFRTGTCPEWAKHSGII